MREDDRLERVLGEWQAPEPPAAMDARMLAAYREAVRPTPWRRLMPAAALLIAAALVIGFRWGQPQPQQPQIRGYVTRIDAAGFQPLPNGAVRVVKREAVLQ